MQAKTTARAVVRIRLLVNEFVYDVHMSVVGYTMHMDLDDTFGEAILEMCAANAWRVGDWDFMFHSRYHVSRHATPSMMGTDT